MADANHMRIAEILKFSDDRGMIEEAVFEMLRLGIDRRLMVEGLTPERLRWVSGIALPVFNRWKKGEGASEQHPDDIAALATLGW